MKGINSDLHPRYNKEHYNYALNATLEGDVHPYISSDYSNEFCVDFEATPIGHCIDKDNNFIVFLDNNSIVRFYPDNCSFTTIYSNPDLKFGNWIECIYTQLRGCEEVVYFTDGINKYRVINLSRVKPTTQVNELLFNVQATSVNITPSIIEGGSLNSGSYWYTIRTVDDSGTPSNWSEFYPPVYIQQDKLKYLGLDKVPTSLSIEFKLSKKINGSFQIGVVEYSNLNKAVSKVYVLPENVTYFTGTNYSSLESLNSLIVDNLIVDVINTNTLHLNRLFIGNITNK
jgi:hypothetical protein